jgi:hypothetical protein
MLTAYILLALNISTPDIPLIEAGQTSAPVCIEYCTEDNQ